MKYKEVHMTEKKDLEGRQVRLVDFPGEVFYLRYAGWEDQWIVRRPDGTDMMRASGDEALPYLTQPYDATPGWKQRIQYELGHRHPSQIIASQEEYGKPVSRRRYITKHMASLLYPNPVSVVNALQQSMDEEQTAVDWYSRRAIFSRQNGDWSSAELWEHIASEEGTHYNELRQRKEELERGLMEQERIEREQGPG